MDFYGSLTVDQLQQAVDMQPEEASDFTFADDADPLP
jgi:hypothetical protein